MRRGIVRRQPGEARKTVNPLYFQAMHRGDIEILLEPLERAKHRHRRRALRSRATAASLLLLIAATIALIRLGERPAPVAALVCMGLAAIVFLLGRLSRMPDAVPNGWLMLAVEARLTDAGRCALTPLLMKAEVSCDEALRWAQEERVRTLDSAGSALDIAAAEAGHPASPGFERS